MNFKGNMSAGGGSASGGKKLFTLILLTTFLLPLGQLSAQGFEGEEAIFKASSIFLPI